MAEVHARHPEADVTLRWVPGHMDIEGNELADCEAKRAAAGSSSPLNKLPKCLHDGLQFGVSKLKQVYRADLHQVHRKEWQESKRGQKLARLDPGLPSPRFMTKLAAPLRRRQLALLLQLRTGRIPLNDHLAHIGKVPRSTCPTCRQAPETVRHYLLECSTYARHRWRLTHSLGRAGLSLSTLLNTTSALTPLFRYIADTRRFFATFGNVELLDPDLESAQGGG
ncbi:hypothetical protein C8Q76DRAFT_729717 [Earliella scabrosa]|nr:hypothetical protein C8Q76DRAFT_729717 [Earliella scabrosa]